MFRYAKICENCGNTVVLTLGIVEAEQWPLQFQAGTIALQHIERLH